MTKNDRIINIVFNTIRIRLNKSHLNSSTINNNGIYSVEPNFRRKENYWHLVLINNTKEPFKTQNPLLNQKELRV